MKIGFIGFGRLGKLIAEKLSQDSELLIYDIKESSREIKEKGATPATLKEVCQCPIIIPFVPISTLEEVLIQMAKFIRPDALVIDVCSVKVEPLTWMKKHLPQSVSLLGTHPMFGPDSARDTLYGAKIVLCPIRIDPTSLKNIKAYLCGHGLNVMESTAEKHDREIAQGLLLTHFIGRGLMEFKATSLSIDTKGYRRLMRILKTVENDSWQLFEDMNKYNPYARETLHKFTQSLQHIHKKISS